MQNVLELGVGPTQMATVLGNLILGVTLVFLNSFGVGRTFSIYVFEGCARNTSKGMILWLYHVSTLQVCLTYGSDIQLECMYERGTL